MTPEEKLKKFMKVTTKDILDVAKKIIDPKKFNLALIGPFKDKKEFEGMLKM